MVATRLGRTARRRPAAKVVFLLASILASSGARATEAPSISLETRCFPAAIGGKVHCKTTLFSESGATLAGTITVGASSTVRAGKGAGTSTPIAAVVPDGLEWSCSSLPSGAVSCELPAALLPPGGEPGFDLWIETGELVRGGGLGVQTCARIERPGGGIESCDHAGSEILARAPNPAACPAEGPCDLGFTIANTSDLPYQGSVLVTANITNAQGAATAPIMSAVPPLDCKGGARRLPLSCETPIALGPGEQQTYWFSVARGSAERSCFTVIDPLLADSARLVKVPANAMGLVTASGYVQCFDLRPPTPRCPDSARRKPDGGCCDHGSRWTGRACGAATASVTAEQPPSFDPPPLQPPGSQPPSPLPGTPPTRCSGGTVLVGGSCKCPRGTRRHDGACRARPDKKGCPRGYKGSPPNCRRIVEKCPEGWAGTPPNCVKRVTPTGCKRGYRRGPNGCVPIFCRAGEVRRGNKCIKVLAPTGTRACGRGMRRNASGACVRIGRPKRPATPIKPVLKMPLKQTPPR